MEWLLIFVWWSSSGMAITTERFATETECKAIAEEVARDADRPFMPDPQSWRCVQVEKLQQ